MIRNALHIDVEALVRLEHACFKTDLLDRDDFRRELRNQTTVLLVHEGLGGVDAYALMQVRHARAHLVSIAVDPAHRRSGIGKTLLQAAEQAAAERGAGHMRLEIREDNPGAYALYRAMGYRHFGTWLEYYQDKSDALRMQKPLAARHEDEDTDDAVEIGIG